MSVPIVAAVADDGPAPKVDVAAANASAEVDSHTPEPPSVPVVEVIPDPGVEPTDGDNALDDLRKTVADLATTLATVVEKVIGAESDAKPDKGPWTHRGSRREP